MSHIIPAFRRFAVAIALLCLITLPASAAETCFAGNEMDAASKSAIEAAANRYFNALVNGDAATLKQSVTPALSPDFVDNTIKEHRDALAGGQPSIRASYLLVQDGPEASPQAAFYCGVWKTPGFVGFQISNLPPGKYAVVIADATGTQEPQTVSFVLQQEGTNWRLAGLYPKPKQVNGHNATWYWTEARKLNNSGNKMMSALYYQIARDLMLPVPFIATDQIEKFFEEQANVQAPNVPVNGPVNFAAGDKQFKLTQLFPLPQKDGLYLVVKHETPSIDDTAKSAQDNIALINALVKQNPDLRQNFTAVVARAVTPQGGDYGTMLTMKDIK